MAVLNSNKFGISDGFARAGEIALFHIASNALVIIGAAVANYHPSKLNDVHYLYAASAIALANMVIGGISKWLTVHGPTETTPTEQVPVTGVIGASGSNG